MLIYARKYIPKLQQLPQGWLHNRPLGLLTYQSKEPVLRGAIAVLQGCIFICLLLVSLALIAGRALGTDATTDPFVAYTALMPGAPRPSGSDFQCEIPYEYPQAASYFYCVQYLDNPNALRWVSISGSNGGITRIGFGVRMRYGDLVALLGRPQRISGTRWNKILHWSDVQGYVSVPRGSRLTLRSRVSYVAFFIEATRNG